LIFIPGKKHRILQFTENTCHENIADIVNLLDCS